MKRHSIGCFSLGLVLSLGLAGLGCSSSDSPSVDAGKKDGSAGSGGKGGSTGGGGSGGTSATGGVTGTGGSGGSASGGSNGAGGSSAGGSSAGGSSAGGSVGGAGGSNVGGANGGSTGTGGSGAGGSSSIDGGSVDTNGSDASDAPLGQDASIDTGTVSLDTGALDVAEDMATPMDTGIDISPVDMSGIDGGNPIPCSEIKVIAAGTQSTGYFGTKGNFCFATCDTIAGWGVSNFEGRSLLLINGQEVAISSAGVMPLPTAKVAGYTVFQVNGGDSAVDYASMYWWGTAATSCTAPAGGFGLN